MEKGEGEQQDRRRASSREASSKTGGRVVETGEEAVGKGRGRAARQEEGEKLRGRAARQEGKKLEQGKK